MKYIILAIVLAVTAVQAQDKSKPTVAAMPPSVVKTVPQAGDTNVDPGLKEISVTFSKDMLTDKMWSWCSQSPDTFPETDSKKIRYLKDRRTCVLPVKLQPGKTYIIRINPPEFNSFRDTAGNPAIPYLLVFQTASHADFKAAVAAAEKWLRLADDGKYGESWDTAADFFRKSIPRKQCEYIIGKTREKLGKKISRKFSAKTYHTTLPNAPDGTYIIMEFRSSFENRLSAVETVTAMRDKDGKWRIAGYYIN
ncbi:MAG: DUF4019 domain-containing protein [Victivallaceae bacterium]|nr:DUF4019 domain-containing protein [Victivallaceae bacterium]